EYRHLDVLQTCGGVELHDRLPAADVARDRRRGDYIGDLPRLWLVAEGRREPALHGAGHERLHALRLGDADALLPLLDRLRRLAMSGIGEHHLLETFGL